jgi:hypothetical protein
MGGDVGRWQVKWTLLAVILVLCGTKVRVARPAPLLSHLHNSTLRHCAISDQLGITFFAADKISEV